MKVGDIVQLTRGRKYHWGVYLTYFQWGEHWVIGGATEEEAINNFKTRPSSFQIKRDQESIIKTGKNISDYGINWKKRLS